MNWSGGTISGITSLETNIAFNLTGTGDKTLFLGTLTNNGTVNWNGGNLVASYDSVINNNATFVLQSSGYIYDNGGSGLSLPVFINNGLLQKTNSNGVTTIGADGYGGWLFSQNGTINLQSGSLSIDGSYAVSGSPQLKLVLGGPNPGTQFSQEIFTGVATLGGTLRVTLANGFTPTNGQSFAIINYGSAGGRFASLQLPPLAFGSTWSVDYGATALTLRVAPQAVLSNGRLTFNGHFLVTLAGSSASSAVLWASPDLINWSAIATNAPFTGSFIFDDPWASFFTQRYYRTTLFP